MPILLLDNDDPPRLAPASRADLQRSQVCVLQHLLSNMYDKYLQKCPGSLQPRAPICNALRCVRCEGLRFSVLQVVIIHVCEPFNREMAFADMITKRVVGSAARGVADDRCCNNRTMADGLAFLKSRRCVCCNTCFQT